MSVEDDAFKSATGDLKFNLAGDRLRGAFARRRVQRLHVAHSGWDATKLATQIRAELATVGNYLAGKDALIKGTETTAPTHLDLHSEAAAISGPGSFTAPFVEGVEKVYRASRASWVPQIVWGAVGLHAELWKSEGPPPQLQKAALDEILDRRLRAVEQMSCNVNAAQGFQLQTLARTWTIAGPAGPWTDGFVVRNFEYPVLPSNQFAGILPRLSEWKQKYGIVIVFTPPPGQAPVYFPKDVRKAWLVKVTKSGTMWVTYQPSTTVKPADVVHRLFSPPRMDFMDRNWLFCDMVSSAVHLEAFMFANRRRKGNDDDFNAVANRTDYMRLGPVVQFDSTHDLDILMCDDQDPFFENLDLSIDELQVGDFVCFWSSRVYDLIVPDGAWRNEFSLVMQVDPDGPTGKVRVLSNGPQIWLAGHGVDTILYNGMASNLVDWIGKALLLLYVELVKSLAQNPAATQVTTSMGQTLVLWTPYEPFDPPGAWWLKIPKQIWHDEWNYATVQDVLKAVPRTVSKETGGTGYNPPEDDVVYFPLYEPAVGQTPSDGDSWRAYLRQRKAKATFRAPTSLKPLTVDGRLALGLFYRGAKTTLPVVRPRVRT